MASSKECTPINSLSLQQLIAVDSVAVNQKSTTFANKYVVTTAGGELLFNVKEEASALEVMMGGTRRGFHIDLWDTNNQQVISLRRPYSFGVSKLQVRVGGELASVVRQEPTFLKPVFSINDANDTPTLRVKGPVGHHSGECDFDLFTLDKRRIGFIKKKWKGLARELFTDTTSFQIQFPLDLDVRYKAAVIGTCLLIDFLFYGKNG